MIHEDCSQQHQSLYFNMNTFRYWCHFFANYSTPLFANYSRLFNISYIATLQKIKKCQPNHPRHFRVQNLFFRKLKQDPNIVIYLHSFFTRGFTVQIFLPLIISDQLIFYSLLLKNPQMSKLVKNSPNYQETHTTKNPHLPKSLQTPKNSKLPHINILMSQFKFRVYVKF